MADNGKKAEQTTNLRKSLRLVVIGVCFAMVFVAAVMSPPFVKYLVQLGATDFHFGLIAGVPCIMLFFQFVGAVWANHVRRRKALFMTLVIAGRLLYIPIGFMALLFPGLSGNVAVNVIVVILGISSVLMNLSGPVWVSWMADLVPHRVLNRYWGNRYLALQVTWMLAFLAVWAFLRFSHLPINVAFPILVLVGVVAGVIDIALFAWVDEPTNVILRGKPVLETFTAPFRHVEYRTFVTFKCVWDASTMFAGGFLQVYLIKSLGLGADFVTLMWCAAAVGAFSAPMWGRLADKHGNKPVMTICAVLKPLHLAAFCLVTPTTVAYVVPAVLVFDSIWESGILVATNGYMMKFAPQENRSMFVAAIAGIGGLCAGAASVAGGGFLHVFDGWSASFLGQTWTNYQLLFFINMIMRFGCVYYVCRVKEPKSSKSMFVLGELMHVWPMNLLLAPVAAYRRRFFRG